MVLTPSATDWGIEMDGNARESRASEPRVLEARRRRSAERIRDKVERRKGKEPEVGVPSSDKRCVVKVSKGCLRSSTWTRVWSLGKFRR